MKKVFEIFSWCMSLVILAAQAQTTQSPEVVVSIKPIHALVSGVMGDVGEPVLLLQGNESPHSYSLRPSQMRQLYQADLVVWIGENMESFLAKPLQNIDGQIISLLDTPNLTVLKPRHGGYWETTGHHQHVAHEEKHQKNPHESHHDDHHHHHHHDGEVDMHIWLSPTNAQQIVKYITATLSQLYPEYSAIFQANAERIHHQLQDLDTTLATQLNPVQQHAYLVFHDAYQYFEQHYGLNAVGTVSVNPEQRPSAKRLHELRQQLATQQVVCIFSEPQFTARWLNSIIEGSQVKRGVLDPLGSELKAGETAYSTLLHNLADTLVNCLADSASAS